jgi:hypothetical protein
MYFKWKVVYVHLEVVLVLAQDRCMVCAECTICLVIILGAPMVLLHNMGQVENHLDPFGNSVNLYAR